MLPKLTCIVSKPVILWLMNCVAERVQSKGFKDFGLEGDQPHAPLVR